MKQREQLENTGLRVLSYARRELLLSMRFLASALDRLPCRMDLTTRGIGTDGFGIRFNPAWVFRNFAEQPVAVNRAYVHMLLHCLFRHVHGASRHENAALWDLASDIAAEHVLDSMESQALWRTPSDFREWWYGILEDACGILTAEKIYVWLSSGSDEVLKERIAGRVTGKATGKILNFEALERLAREFSVCDHSFWEREPERRKEDAPERPDIIPPPMRRNEEDWTKEAKRLRVELETFGKEAGTEEGELSRLLRFETRERTAYREWLERFSVLRETAETDPDSFDYGYYNFGLTVYGNLPLIEEHELREVKKVEELVIVLDTSASCQEALVQQFLNETAALLSAQDSYFRKVRIHLIECDEKVRKDTLLEEPGELKQYAEGFQLKGGMGTDFRPVFRYVEELMALGALRDLRGLLYFTDGFGPFPEEAPAYETAFVFRKDLEYDDSRVPDWALKLYL